MSVQIIDKLHFRRDYFNFLPQPHFSLPPQLGEKKFHFVGLSKNLHPPSPSPPPHATRTQIENSIEIDDDVGVGASKHVKKRYWIHDEKVRLVNTQLPWFPHDFVGRYSFYKFSFAGKCLVEHF